MSVLKERRYMVAGVDLAVRADETYWSCSRVWVSKTGEECRVVGFGDSPEEAEQRCEFAARNAGFVDPLTCG